ncbi:DUF4194 domain-containing protein [Chitinophaga sancti]|uniref:DUF4194 domain-containing protein n=1 Tax=Chitinophaga sancti TaxID=1004 RepID=A0A1K1STB7_9BACT|nr:DUF4194 domain-containing protein [Chitinophaga sancti]WQD60838.1 DUF4194 domain-containing protein [Chitinophaga sancti]WQG87034.1 DUF4194 domain-containing protein [Chitinophaga sancti]SFW87656.1 protein of unknown function [Chitinophaga sancti]
MSTPVKILPYASLVVKLLKGPVEYVEKSAWEKLLQYKVELIIFLQQLGLTLVLDEQDGYAFVKHAMSEDEEAYVSWVQRRSFSYEESIMLVLLREMMAEFEISDSSSRELIKKRREIKEYAELFFKEGASRIRFLRDIDRLIDKVEENGFLQKIENHDLIDEQKFRIRKIIKAKVDSEALEQFQQQLLAHQEIPVEAE